MALEVGAKLASTFALKAKRMILKIKAMKRIKVSGPHSTKNINYVVMKMGQFRWNFS